MSHKHIPTVVLAALLSIAGFIGCNKRSDFADDRSSNATHAVSELAAPRAATDSVGGSPARAVMTNGIDSADSQILNRPKVVVKNGDLSLKAEDYVASMDKIRAATVRYGGYIAREHVRTLYENAIEAELTIRVPSQYFDTTLALIKKMGDKITNEDITAEELTEQYEQSTSDLKDLRAESERLQAMLRSSLTVKQRLDVESRLAEIRSELSSQQSGHNSLVRHVAYSTLHIELNADQKPGPFMRVWIAFKTGMDQFVDVFARLLESVLGALPVLALLGLFGYGLYWLIKRGQRANARYVIAERAKEDASMENR